MINQRKILLLEDDKLLAESLEDFLSTHNYCIDIAYDGKDALEKHYQNRYDLYLFDINVPYINGLDLLQNLRQCDDNVPTIFLTSYKDSETLKKAFHSGCDDYMKKPFDLDELVYRIKVLLKRAVSLKEKVYFSDYCYYSFSQRTVYHHDKDSNLPLKSIYLLELFLEHTNQTITKTMIVNRLWSPSQKASEHAIRSYIHQLRQYIGKDKIATVKGIGYKYTI